MKISNLYEQLKKAEEVGLNLDDLILEFHLSDGYNVIIGSPIDIKTDYTSEMGKVIINGCIADRFDYK